MGSLAQEKPEHPAGPQNAPKATGNQGRLSQQGEADGSPLRPEKHRDGLWLFSKAQSNGGRQPNAPGNTGGPGDTPLVPQDFLASGTWTTAQELHRDTSQDSGWTKARCPQAGRSD